MGDNTAEQDAKKAAEMVAAKAVGMTDFLVLPVMTPQRRDAFAIRGD